MRAGAPAGTKRLAKYTKLYSLDAAGGQDDAHEAALQQLVQSGRLSFAEKQVPKTRVLRGGK